MENYYYIKQLIENNNENIFIENFDKLIYVCTTSEIYLLFRDEKIVSLIINNDLFFRYISVVAKKVADIYPLLYDLYDYDKKYIINNMNKIIDYQFNEYGFIASYYDKFFNFCNYINYSISNVFEYLDKNIKLTSSFDVLTYIASILKKDEVSKNIDYFINKSNHLLDLKKILVKHNYDNNIINKIDKKIDDNLDTIVYEIIDDRLNVEDIKNEKILDFVKELVKELTSYEKVNYHQIEKLVGGAYSAVFKIGNKVLKIGTVRHNFKIKDNKRFLKPLYRNEIKSINNDNVVLCVEITEVVDTNNITIDDVYYLYKELRVQNLVWTDCRIENVGRLIRDNKIYFDGISKVDKNATGYLNENNEILKKGQLVIIDNDYIYEADDFFNNKVDNLAFIPSDNYYEFERRYNLECIGENYERNKQ